MCKNVPINILQERDRNYMEHVKSEHNYVLVHTDRIMYALDNDYPCSQKLKSSQRC